MQARWSSVHPVTIALRFALCASALAGLAIVAGVVGAAPTRPNMLPAPNRCVFGRHWGGPVTCTQFKTVGMRILKVFPNAAFGKDTQPDDVAVLDDGTVLVHTVNNGLYRIVNGRIVPIWHSRSHCGPFPRWTFGFEQAFDDEMLVRFRTFVENNVTHIDKSSGSWLTAIRADGSTAFRWPPSPAQTETITKDASGVVWALNKGSPQSTLFAYFPDANRAVPVESADAVVKLFHSPNGHVYATTERGLFVLESRPKVRARMVRHAIADTFQAVGRDGALWATTPYDVVHLHPNGETVVIQLGDTSEPSESGMFTPPNIALTMTQDGAVWTTDGSVRIGTDDRITVTEQPEDADHGDVHVGPDGTMWVVARDTQSSWGQPFGVVHFGPASRLPGDAWPFKDLTEPPPPTPSTPCPPPPTPFVPLPPRSDAVYYVYAATDNPTSIWGYWADRGGALKPLRGSPYLTKATSITIDPSGRFAYGGSWYDGVFAYRIDPTSGALIPIPGSPFPSGAGPATIVMDARSRFAYANDFNGKSISVFTIDDRSGALHPISGSPFATNGWPRKIVLDPTLHVVYVVLANGVIQTYSDADDGFRLLAISRLDHDAAGTSAILSNRYGQWPYFTYVWRNEATRYAIDPRSGAVRAAGSQEVAKGSDGDFLVEDPRSRFLYVSNPQRTASIFGFSIDRRNGALVRIAGSPFTGADNAEVMAITPDGALLYVSNFDSKTIAAFRIDQRTGALAAVRGSPFRAGRFPDIMATCKRVGDRCKP